MAEDIYRQVDEMLKLYRRNPGVFTDNDIATLQQLTQMIGVPFEPKSSFKRKVGIGIQEAVDTALLGAIPESVKLGKRTTGERIAGGVGDIAGLAVPVGAPGLLAKGAGKVATKGMARLEALATKTGVPQPAYRLAREGFKGVRGTEDLSRYAAMQMRKGTQVAVDRMKKYGLESQAKSFRNFMHKQAKGLQGLEGFGVVGRGVARFGGSPMAQQAVGRAASFGTRVAAGDLLENVGEGKFDQIITDFMGGASVGAIGGFLGSIPGKNKFFNIRNLARGIVAYSAGQGIPLEEDRIYARLLTLAGLTVGKV